MTWIKEEQRVRAMTGGCSLVFYTVYHLHASCGMLAGIPLESFKNQSFLKLLSDAFV
jgi:hypothetical protein